MGRFLKTVGIGLVAFGLPMGLWFSVQSRDIVVGMASGLAAGLLFGVLMGGFTAYQRRRFTREDPCNEDERLIRDGPANHFRGWEGVGGWLYLTDKRLMFRSHKVNIRHHQWSTPLGEIISAQPRLTAWIIPNGLSVQTPLGTERFVVHDRHGWVEAILRATAG